MKTPSPAPPLLSRPGDIAPLVARVDAHREIAIDTEGDSFHHYGERLCLLQLTIAGEDVLVDPMAPGVEITPLLELLGRKRLLLHGADFDLRLLGLGYGFRAGELFDTMIAAQYLGEAAIGLAALLEKNFGIVLDKTMQRADWSRRPLSDEMKRYAALDTHHLAELVAALSERLVAMGRDEWHREACARLASIVPSPRTIDFETDWRIKGSRELSDAERAVLREAWGWREGEARRRDVPPFRVANDEQLLRLVREARALGGAEAALDRWKVPLSGSPRAALVEALRKGLSLPPDQWPPNLSPHRPPRPDAATQKRLARLRTVRDRLAKELALEPGIVAPRAALEAIAALPDGQVDQWKETGRLLGWQARLLSEAFAKSPAA